MTYIEGHRYVSALVHSGVSFNVSVLCHSVTLLHCFDKQDCLFIGTELMCDGIYFTFNMYKIAFLKVTFTPSYYLKHCDVFLWDIMVLFQLSPKQQEGSLSAPQ